MSTGDYGTIMAGGKKHTIAAWWSCDDGNRWESLERARQCAALTLPWILPPEHHDKDDRLPTNFQSIGADGLQTLAGKWLLALYPPDRPWFQTKLRPSILYDPRVSPEFKELAAQMNFLDDLTLISILESANTDSGLFSPGFRSSRIGAMLNLCGTGDSLLRMNPDFTETNFRRDQYVTERDSSCRFVRSIVKEQIDPDELPEEDRAKISLPRDHYDKPPWDRKVDLYTMNRWNPGVKKWVITQECKEQEIRTSEEPYSPFISTAYQLVQGENYGRGAIEARMGDLWSSDNMSRYTIDWAGAAATIRPFIDELSDLSEEDINDQTENSGKIKRAKVRDGKVLDFGYGHVEGLSDFKVIEITAARVEARLSRSLMLEAQAIRDSERTTKAEVNLTSAEVRSGHAHIYPFITEQQHAPTVAYRRHQMQKKGLLPIRTSREKETFETVILTGTMALANQEKANDLMSFTQAILAINPAALEIINLDVASREYARLKSIYVPGLVRSPEEVQANRQAAIAQQLQLTAGEKIIDTAGNIAENTANAAV